MACLFFSESMNLQIYFLTYLLIFEFNWFTIYYSMYFRIPSPDQIITLKE